MPAVRERPPPIATAIRPTEVICGIQATPVQSRMKLVRGRRILGGSMTCTEMCGSGVLTGTAVCQVVQILKVHPRGRTGCYAAAAGSTMRPTAPRPTGTTASRRTSSTTSASALSEPCLNKAREHNGELRVKVFSAPGFILWERNQNEELQFDSNDNCRYVASGYRWRYLLG